MGEKNIVVPAGKLAETSVSDRIESHRSHRETTKLKVGVYSGGKRVQTVKTFSSDHAPRITNMNSE